MNDELMEAQVIETCVACGRMTALHLTGVHDSVEHAIAVPSTDLGPGTAGHLLRPADDIVAFHPVTGARLAG
jgi:hypothetical protein